MLVSGMRSLGLDPEPGTLDSMRGFLDLLRKWNRTHNLTAVTEPKDMVSHHLLDSLAIHTEVRGSRILDIGTGGGFPAIPLAICFPQWQVTALDSRQKKISFVRYAAANLGLGNVTTVCARVEDFRPEAKFDTLVSRAVGSVSDLSSLADHLLKSPVRVIHMKGKSPERERQQLPLNLRSRTSIVALDVPGLKAERHLVITDI